MKAVLLDFNGTLFSDTRFHIAAWRSFWKEKLGLDLTEDEIRRRCIGPGNIDIFRDFLGGDLPKEERLILEERKEEKYRGAVRAEPENMKLRPGTSEFLDEVRRRGIPCILATASPLSNVRFYLDELGLSRWFTLDTIVYETGELPGKPDPAFYLEAARRAGEKPEDCLIAEDSLTGLKAAIRAGAGRIIMVGGTTSPEALLPYKNDIFAEVKDFVGFERYLL